ncbi:MAG: site-specific integrase [Neisseriaceae bacterium]|nr:site-specific integrase [Neisseriaceae bacterium]
MLYKRNEIWYADYTNASGERIRRSLGTTDKQAALELHDKIKYEQWRIDRIGEKPKRTWDEACIRWLDEKGAKKSIEDDKSRMRNLPELRGMLLGDITRDLVMTIIAKKTCSDATKNRYIALIRAIFNRAMKQWEWIDNTPHFSMYSENKKRIRWLTPEQAKRLIEVAPLYMAQMIKFSLATGLRQRNVLTLKWQQIDLERRVCWYYADETKSGRALGVSLNDIAMQVLDEQQGKHPKYVFTNARGTQMRYIQNRDWNSLLQKAEIENFRWHDLRHTWASWLIQRGVPLAALQEMGGWETPSMVQRYAHLSPEHLHKHSALLNDCLL